jgi:hypothetical protein
MGKELGSNIWMVKSADIVRGYQNPEIHNLHDFIEYYIYREAYAGMPSIHIFPGHLEAAGLDDEYTMEDVKEAAEHLEAFGYSLFYNEYGGKINCVRIIWGAV